MNSFGITTTQLKNIPLLARGKVRDVYDLGDKLLVVATDRISAFDVVFAEPIPGKGALLTTLTEFWMKKFAGLIPNHLTGIDPATLTQDPLEQQILKGRAQVVKKAKALPIECVVRGYLHGSGWKDYQKSGEVCGIKLPAGLQLADKLPEPIFTPATKADLGAHDENIAFVDVINKLGSDLAVRLRDTSLAIYRQAARYAEEQGIVIADTKFEFGLVNDELTLIDEVLTPDSSRFWPRSEYRPGVSPPSFDKQIVRDYLETLSWDKSPPAPALPDDVLIKTAQKYELARRLLMDA